MGEVEKINDTEIAVKEYQTQRVVTFKDIDAVHGRPEGTASRNFRTNKNHFIEGEDYFKICVDEIRQHKIMDVSEKAREDITFLTEQGYLMLVKSFTDDLAWDVQRQLVKSYFRKPQGHKVDILTITSRDVAKIIGKAHAGLLPVIRDCAEELHEMGFDIREFYMESEYHGGNNQMRPQFLCTERGCEFLSGRLEPEERQTFLYEVQDRFERLQAVIEGQPIKKLGRQIKAEPNEGDEVFRLYKNNDWGILSMDGEIYNLTPEEFSLVKRLVPELDRRGISEVKAVIKTILETSERSGKLEPVGEHICRKKQSATESVAPKEISRKLKTDPNIPLESIEYLDVMQCKTRYNISRSTLNEIAEIAGAILCCAPGKKRLYSRQVLDDYFKMQLV